MSILEAVRIRALHLPTMIVPRWPRLKVGQAIAEAAKAYDDAVAVPYLIAFGLFRPGDTWLRLGDPGGRARDHGVE